MKAAFFVLLALNLAAGAWLWLGSPVDQLREPGRSALQVVPEQFHLLTDADVARMKAQAEKDAAAQPAQSAPPPAAAVEVPQADCVVIGSFASEASARKLRTRLGEIGVDDRVQVEGDGKNLRLRIQGVDAATESRIHQMLKEYPNKQLEHCIAAPAH